MNKDYVASLILFTVSFFAWAAIGVRLEYPEISLFIPGPVLTIIAFSTTYGAAYFGACGWTRDQILKYIGDKPRLSTDKPVGPPLDYEDGEGS